LREAVRSGSLWDETALRSHSLANPATFGPLHAHCERVGDHGWTTHDKRDTRPGYIRNGPYAGDSVHGRRNERHFVSLVHRYSPGRSDEHRLWRKRVVADGHDYSSAKRLWAYDHYDRCRRRWWRRRHFLPIDHQCALADLPEPRASRTNLDSHQCRAARRHPNPRHLERYVSCDQQSLCCSNRRAPILPAAPAVNGCPRFTARKLQDQTKMTHSAKSGPE